MSAQMSEVSAQVAAGSLTLDTAAIQTVIQSLATLADRREFDSLSELYAPEVVLDYTSLSGGKPETLSPTEIMNRWAAILPGYDRTHHEISLILSVVEGENARSTAHVVADHWLGTSHWQVSGDYSFHLIRTDGQWKIDNHRFKVTGEVGSRDIFGPAAESAKLHPAPWTQRQAARAVVLRFLSGLETKNMAQVNGVWADDAVQEMPYAPKDFPRRVEGRDALVHQYENWPQNTGKASFTEGIVFYPTQDPNLVLVEFHGVCEIIPTKRTYDQRYIGVFQIRSGKISLYREYFDPTAFSYAFGLSEGGNFYKKP